MEAHRNLVRSYRGSLCLVVAALVVAGVVLPPPLADLGGSEDPVPSGASVEEAPGDPGTLAVTWTSNASARRLVVTVEGPAGVAGQPNVTAVALQGVGDRVRFTEVGTTAANQTVAVHVEALGRDVEPRRLTLFETEVGV